jgi:N-acetylmuramoyl-L-alanine amidase
MRFARLSLFAATLACTLCGLDGAYAAAGRPSSPEHTAAVAISAELKSEAGKARLAFVLSRPVEARSFVMERPDRVVIDLPEINFQLPAEAGRRREGLVAFYRYGLFAPGRSRIVVELAQPALPSAIEVAARTSDGATILAVELVKADREAFRRAAKSGREAANDPLVTGSVAAPADKRPLIALDAGHGGIDPGAVASTGAFEKDIVFGFVKRLKQHLEDTGRYRVLLTRDQDVFIALDERVRLARAAKADLFVSLHADSISAAPHIRGATVYTGSEQATDAESANLADRENKADAVGGVEARDGPSEVADILQDLTLRETRSFSHRLARNLLGAIDPVMALSKKPHREAAFRVLRAPDVPSVLVELGYLSSRKDIDLLTSKAWQDSSAAAMTAAIDRYFGARVAGMRNAPVSP